MDLNTVKGCAEFLDEKVPGWYKRIDCRRLNLMYYHKCILGQLYGSYTKGVYKLNLDHLNVFKERQGFSYKASTEEWKEEINNRMNRDEATKINEPKLWAVKVDGKLYPEVVSSVDKPYLSRFNVKAINHYAVEVVEVQLTLK